MAYEAYPRKLRGDHGGAGATVRGVAIYQIEMLAFYEAIDRRDRPFRQPGQTEEWDSFPLQGIGKQTMAWQQHRHVVTVS